MAIFSAIERESAKETVVERVRQAILAGELAPGERITEIDLAKSFAVGQATVREALIELQHLGFVGRREPRKTFVTSLTREDILKIYAIRIPLELLAIQFAVEARQDLSELEQCLLKMEKAAETGDIRDFKARDLDFHAALWRATGNPYMVDCLVPLVGQLFAFASSTIRPKQQTPDDLRALVALHRDILTGIQSGHVDAAQEALRASMDMSWVEDHPATAEPGTK